MKRRIKVLLAKLGLDVHNRGLVTVATLLRDAGMEVVYIGNALNRQILQTAVEEDVDVVGVSSLGGAHISLGGPLVEAAAREGMKDRTVFLIGGVFPPEDGERMKRMGFAGVFGPGATGQDIVTEIHRLVGEKTRPES
jgi:methylmalonyl-CoA mutase C-terminal domain/subunit